MLEINQYKPKQQTNAYNTTGPTNSMVVNIYKYAITFWHRPGFEPGTSWSKVQHSTAMPFPPPCRLKYRDFVWSRLKMYLYAHTGGMIHDLITEVQTSRSLVYIRLGFFSLPVANWYRYSWFLYSLKCLSRRLHDRYTSRNTRLLAVQATVVACCHTSIEVIVNNTILLLQT